MTVPKPKPKTSLVGRIIGWGLLIFIAVGVLATCVGDAADQAERAPLRSSDVVAPEPAMSDRDIFRLALELNVYNENLNDLCSGLAMLGMEDSVLLLQVGWEGSATSGATAFYPDIVRDVLTEACGV
ncbi:MAG: hypothetical protein ACRD0W_00860 [Acidimicrobiales bacterium]